MSLKFSLLIFYPFFFFIIYYLYISLKSEINQLHNQRLLLIKEREELEYNIRDSFEDMPQLEKNNENHNNSLNNQSNKVINSSNTNINYKEASALIRLGDDVYNLNNRIDNIKKVLSNNKSELKKQLSSSVKMLIPKHNESIESVIKKLKLKIDNYNNENNVEEYNIDEVSSEISKEIQLSIDLEKKADKYFNSDNDYFNKISKEVNILHNQFLELKETVKNDLTQFRDILNDILINKFKLYNYEKEINELKNGKSLNQLDYRNLNSLSNLTIKELEEQLIAYMNNTNKFYDNNQWYLSNHLLSKNLNNNIIIDEDYNLLKTHFKKEFSINKVISKYQNISKDLFDNSLINKENLFLYIETYSKKRIGFYIHKKFPKYSKLSKYYKDDDCFIAHLDQKEIYLADPSKNMHYKTDLENLLFIGNTQNKDGIWFSLNNHTNLNNTDFKLIIGKITDQFIIENNKLFGSLNYDIIFNFEVYQFNFN